MDNNQNPNNGFNNVNPTNNLNNNGNINNENYNGMYNPLNQPTQPLNNVPNQGAGEQVINQTQSAYQQPVMSQPQDNYQQPMMSQPQNNYQEPIINQPQDNFQQPMDSPTNDFNGADVKKPKIKLILIIVLAAAVIGVGAFLLLRKDLEKNDGIDITDSTSFFIQDKNEKYALFNEEGKQLTDFIFSYTGNFINGTTIVKKNDAYGIINENGKMTVDFGKYKYISSDGGMYYVRREDKQEFLINGSGKVLYELNDNTFLHTYVAQDKYLMLEDTENKFYKIINYKGETVFSLNEVSNIKTHPDLSLAGEYFSIFYNNKIHIIKFSTKKEVMSFDSNTCNIVKFVVDNGKIIAMESCDDSIISESNYKIIKDGKVIDLKDKCDNLTYSNNNFICSKQLKEHLLDKNFNVGIETYLKAYVDNDTYAATAENYNSVNFYNNGKVIKNVECRKLSETGYMENGLYVLTTHNYESCSNVEPYLYEYYKANGEKAFEKSFKYAYDFNENGTAIVSEDKENYYLIDSNGKKVSQEYTKISRNIYTNGNYFIVTKNDKEGLIDLNGNVIVECEYEKIELEEKNAIFKTAESKYIVYNLNTKKEIMTTDTKPVLWDHYIVISKDENKQYYTYKGKLFYEEK